MRCSPLFLIAAMLQSASGGAAAQTPQDTLPERVVERALNAFMRGDVPAYVAEWDSLSYFQDLEPRQVATAHPGAPKLVRAEERARRLREYLAKPDPRGRGHIDLIQRLVAGRFVVNHIAVWWDPPYGDSHNFQKLEIYEVRNGKIVAEYDGQAVAADVIKRPAFAPSAR